MRTLAAAIALLALPTLATAQGRTPRLDGVWRNAANSVHLRAAPCIRGGRALCGTVIWASERAKADVAARGRTLIGTRLFEDFQPGDDGRWEGTVYVPDIDRSLAGTIRLDGPDRLVGEGCLFGTLGCREQVWTRVRQRR